MIIADDELLALILRFVALDKKQDASDDAFLREQIQAMKQYLDRFPEEQQAERAMEWVQKKAENYRRNWQNREAGRRSFSTRCKDCPLRKRGAEVHCEIHEQWVYLLQRYIAGTLASKKYVRQSLQLLKAHKKDLKRRLSGDYETWKSKKRSKKILVPK